MSELGHHQVVGVLGAGLLVDRDSRLGQPFSFADRRRHGLVVGFDDTGVTVDQGLERHALGCRECEVVPQPFLADHFAVRLFDGPHELRVVANPAIQQLAESGLLYLPGQAQCLGAGTLPLHGAAVFCVVVIRTIRVVRHDFAQ